MRKFLFLALGAMLLAWPSAARAEVIIYIYQSGSDVVVTGGGTLDTTDLQAPFQTNSVGADVYGADGSVRVGPAALTNFEAFGGISGPTSWVSGSFAEPDSGSGDVFGVFGLGGTMFAPENYVSGTSLSATDTYANTSLGASGLNMTNGTYTYTWGTDIHADSLVVNVGVNPSAVPEPGSMALVLSAAAIGMGARTLSRRRVARA